MRLHLNQSSSSSSSSCKTKYIFGPNTRTDIWPAFPQLLPVVHVVRSAAVTPSLLIVARAAGRLPGPSPPVAALTPPMHTSDLFSRDTLEDPELLQGLALSLSLSLSLSVCSPPEKSHTRRHPKNHTFHKPFGLPPASRRAVGHAATALGCGPAHSPTMVQISSVPWVRGTRRVPVAPDAASSTVPSSGIVGCQYRHLPDTIFDSRVRLTRGSIVG